MTDADRVVGASRRVINLLTGLDMNVSLNVAMALIELRDALAEYDAAVVKESE